MDEHQQSLKSYIQLQLQAGLSPDEISAHLRSAGWPDAQIHQAFTTLQQEMMPSDLAATQQTGVIARPHAGAPVTPQAVGRRRGRIKTGWLLFKQALKVLDSNRYLLRYLLMTGVCVFAISAVIIGIMVLLINMAWAGAPEQTVRLLYYATAFLDYVMIYFFVNLYAAGLAANVLDIFDGKRQPYSAYMRLARAKAGPIFVFSLMTATIGMFLQFVVERIRFVGWILSWVLGTIWSLGTMFVLPIIISSPQTNAFRAVGQSVRFFKHTWGENIVTKASVNVPLGIINFCITVAFGFFLIPATYTFGLFGFWFIVTAWLIVALSLAVVGSFANSVINVALYYYAAFQKVPPAFSADLLNDVFIKRSKRFSKKTEQ